jgi:hypothetical protein
MRMVPDVLKDYSAFNFKSQAVLQELLYFVIILYFTERHLWFVVSSSYTSADYANVTYISAQTGPL